MMQWEPVIGLEVHAQLLTQSKMFSGAATAYGALPNTQACPIDLALPGTLPVPNETAIRMAVKFGLGINAIVNKKSIFDRKNYFYPDLPKGYQISQFEFPIVGAGYLDITLEDGSLKRIHITRAHLEEDAGKSLHEDFPNFSLLDLNRAGVPLLEIVSEPELRSAKEAVAYLKTLHALVRYLEICDGNLQEGSFRCDANVSVRPLGAQKFGVRTEIKNVNSFRFVEKAIDYEIQRQIEVLENNGTLRQETRLYDADKNQTRPMREKETANDYRYFPDPDLLPIVLTDAFIAEVRSTLPELPQQKKERFQRQYSLSEYDASVLVTSKELAQYFEETIKQSHAPAKTVANWIMVELMSLLNKHNLDIVASPIVPGQLAQLLNRIVDGTISGKIAKTIFEDLWHGAGQVDDIIASKGLQQVSDSAALEKIIAEVIAACPQQVAEYRSGKEKLFGFFVGQVMKASRGQANPEQLNHLLKTKLAGE